MSTLNIFDCSLWQLVHWETVSATAHVAFIKATDGQNTRDPVFDYNWSESKTHRVARSPYHYFRARKLVSSARKQAEHHLKTLAAAGGPGDLLDPATGRPLTWLDCERNDEDLTQNELENALWKYINTIEDNGLAVGIYTSQAWWNTCVTGPHRQTDIPRDRLLWISNPRLTGDPSIPWDWSKRYFAKPSLQWEFHQYSFKGYIAGIFEPNKPGVLGDVDLNRCRWSLETASKRYGVEFTPKPAMALDGSVQPPAPEAIPSRVRIAGNLGSDPLRIRSAPFGAVRAQTWKGIEFDVLATKLDPQNRPWYCIGPDMFIASWYCHAVSY